NRVDYFIANSQHTANRIWRCYRRKAKVIYPPVNLERFSFKENKEDFYVTVTRLVSYKQVTLMVEAFNQLGKNLVIIGGGKQLELIQKMAKPNIKILGSQPNHIVEEYLQKAKAFIYASCEDFGIALVEAQACGTPVIAYARGGALETVKDIRQHPQDGTGLHFYPQTPQALAETVETFEEIYHQFNLENCRQQAEKFSTPIFHHNYLNFVESCMINGNGIIDQNKIVD
ncbi:MAG TPA: glycosyltransferase, partial [Allocoleopsis sp.]